MVHQAELPLLKRTPPPFERAHGPGGLYSMIPQLANLFVANGMEDVRPNVVDGPSSQRPLTAFSR